jgi:hypothetical protein
VAISVQLKRRSFWLLAVHSVSPRFFFRGKDISAMRAAEWAKYIWRVILVYSGPVQ